MKTLHQQQDLHHKADPRNKNGLNFNKKEEDLHKHKNSMHSLFPPFNYFGMDDHSLIPFYSMTKHQPKNDGHAVDKNHEITNAITEAYAKQLELSLDAAQKIHKEFVNQLTTLYNFNQQFWLAVCSHK